MARLPNMDSRTQRRGDPLRSSHTGRRTTRRDVPEADDRDMSYGVQFFTVWVGRLGVQPVCSYTPLGWLH